MLVAGAVATMAAGWPAAVPVSLVTAGGARVVCAELLAVRGTLRRLLYRRRRAGKRLMRDAGRLHRELAALSGACLLTGLWLAAGGGAGGGTAGRADYAMWAGLQAGLLALQGCGILAAKRNEGTEEGRRE